MTRDEIRTTLEHANSGYSIVVTFNDDDTIRSIDGWLKGEHRPWRANR
jgi:TusA-related sulfurtransferase